jgi:hypothetical protein
MSTVEYDLAEYEREQVEREPEHVCAWCAAEPEFDNDPDVMSYKELPIQTDKGQFCSDKCRVADMLHNATDKDAVRGVIQAIKALGEHLHAAKKDMGPYIDPFAVRTGEDEFRKLHAVVDLDVLDEWINDLSNQLDLA